MNFCKLIAQQQKLPSHNAVEIHSVGKKRNLAIIFINTQILLNAYGTKANQVQIGSVWPWWNLETILQNPFWKGEKQWKESDIVKNRNCWVYLHI